MRTQSTDNKLILSSIATGLLLVTALLAGCTGSVPQSQEPAATAVPVAADTNEQTPAGEPAAPAVPLSIQATVITTNTPVPVYTYSEGNVIAYTAASLKGVSPKLAEGFARMYPGHTVVFNLD